MAEADLRADVPGAPAVNDGEPRPVGGPRAVRQPDKEALSARRSAGVVGLGVHRSIRLPDPDHEVALQPVAPPPPNVERECAWVERHVHDSVQAPADPLEYDRDRVRLADQEHVDAADALDAADHGEAGLGMGRRGRQASDRKKDGNRRRESAPLPHGPQGYPGTRGFTSG